MGRHIVTVARQFGCGGGEIAKKLAELLSVEYFDKELLEKAAEASGISKDAFERADERAASSFLYSLAMSSYSGHISPVGVNDVMLSDKLFTVQSDAIRKLAAEKKALYAKYRAAQQEMRQAIAAKSNIDHLLGVTDGRKNKEQER